MARFGRVVIATVFMAAVFIAPLHAGWVEVDKNGDVTYLSNGKVKTLPQEMEQPVWEIFDTRAGNITFVDDKNKVYSMSTTKGYCKEMEAFQERMMQGLPPEQRAMLEQMMAGRKPARKLNVTVTHDGNGGLISGYSTKKYSVMVDGKLYSEHWIAEDKALRKEMKEMESLIRMGQQISECIDLGMPGADSMVEVSEEYMELQLKGWTMKKVTYTFGSANVESHVQSLAKKKIPASEFAPPSGYRKVAFSEFFRMLSTPE